MKHKSIAYLFFLLMAAFAMLSCQNRPREVLSRKNMERLMYDVYIAEATMDNDYYNFDTPEKKEAYIRELFRQHRVTQAQWDTSLSWYSDRIDVYLKMNDSVKARLQRAQQSLEARLNAQAALEQQNSERFFSLSYIPATFFFDAEVRNGFRFRLDSAEIAARITDNDFSFSFDVVGIPSAAPAPPLKSALMLEYGDTTIYQSAQITQNQLYSLPAAKFIEGDTLKQINGFVHLQTEPATAHRRIGLHRIALRAQPPDSTQTEPEPPIADELRAMPPDSVQR